MCHHYHNDKHLVYYSLVFNLLVQSQNPLLSLSCLTLLRCRKGIGENRNITVDNIIHVAAKTIDHKSLGFLMHSSHLCVVAIFSD